MNLFARYAALRAKICGDRQKGEFEMTMGPSVAEQNGIVEATPAIKRIIGQLNFALQLSKSREGCYDKEIAAALDVLEAFIEENGVLTNKVCAEAEEKILPLKDASKEYEVLYASHAHIDMNWMWGWQETVAVTLSTFRTMLNLMKEYPEFTFSQSQASVYQIVEEHDPDMMEEIKQRIAEGRWEITANAWVETDKNMPDTESLIRHIGVTRKYLEEHWGIAPGSIKVDFSPDTFGHSRNVPEINNFGSVPYYYHCRGLQQDLTLYRYIAPSGNEVLMYKEPYWYNSGVNVDNGTGVIEMERRCNGLKTSLIVYGVGNHGGGPSRRDIETVLEMQKWPVFPTLRFGTLHEYFKKAEAVREGLPVIDHELNAIFTGCYTTQSRVKLGNRRSEAALLDSERMSAMAHYKLDTKFNSKVYETAWQKVLFTHFHDIITGSGVQETREHAMGKYAEALAFAQTEQAKAFEKLSQNIDTSMFPSDDCICRTLSEGAGVGYGVHNYAGVPNPERGAGKTRVYTVFNSSAVARKENAELTIWDYTGNMNRIEVVDHEGNVVAHQLLDEKPVKYWDHFYIRVLIAADVPPMGYATYAVREKEITEYPTHLLHQEREELPHNAIVLENDKVCARFDTGSGMLHSFVNKATGEEMLSGPAGLHLIKTEDGGMTAWRIGRYLGMEPVTNTTRVRFVKGELRDTVIFDQLVMDSLVYMAISLDKDSDTLSYNLSVDWREHAGEKDIITVPKLGGFDCPRNVREFLPLLAYRLPLKKGSDQILTDVPAGSATRPSRQMDVPALTGACAVVEGDTAAIITDCKYGFRLADDVLSVTLINTSCDPDLYPERGIHAIKLFVTMTDGKPAGLKAKAESLIRPLNCVPTASHAGKLPAKAALMEFCADHCVMTAATVTPDDALNVRMYEVDGQAEEVTVRAPFAPSKAELTNLNGEVQGEAKVDGDKVTFTVGAYRIAQVKIYR